VELTALGFDSAELGLLSPLGPLLRKVVECSAATDPVANPSLSTVSESLPANPFAKREGWPKANKKKAEKAERATKGD
jgi:hypothetical protein